MFGRKNIIKIIRKGDLAGLKQYVEKKPECLNEWFRWSGSSGTALHAAAYFNKPDIIKFLAEKGMNINQRNQVSSRTPLHYAAEDGQYEATRALLELKADSKLKNNEGYTPFDLCRDASTKDLLWPAYKEQREKEKPVRQAEEQQQPEKEPADAATRAEGTWILSPGSTVEVTHQYEAPVGQYQITDIFNFETERLISVTKDLTSGQITPLRQAFRDVSDKEKTQAKAKLDALNSGSAEAAAAPRRDAFQYPSASV